MPAFWSITISWLQHYILKPQVLLAWRRIMQLLFFFFEEMNSAASVALEGC
jgi:hypothetical protein